VFFLAFTALRYKEITRIFNGEASITILFIVFMQTILFPLGFVLIGLYAKSIQVVTGERGIKYNSWFKTIEVRWDEIKMVERESWWLKIKTEKGSFSVSPLISGTDQDVNNSSDRNVYKRCMLLQEIRKMARNAKFKGFPEGTFDTAQTNCK
jgi:hypothetical protein